MQAPYLTPNDSQTASLTLIERHQEHGAVATYVFRPARRVFFDAGQYAHLRMLNMQPGSRRVRELSFASSPQDVEIWFGVDGRSESPYQKALQALRPGDTAELFKIRGHMSWPPPVTDVVMIAGGVGITPFRSMLRDAQQRQTPMASTLLHVSRDFHLYADDMRTLADEYIPLDRPAFRAAVARAASDRRHARFYVAGSEGFVAAAASELRACGITDIEKDEFKGLLDD